MAGLLGLIRRWMVADGSAVRVNEKLCLLASQQSAALLVIFMFKQLVSCQVLDSFVFIKLRRVKSNPLKNHYRLLSSFYFL